MKTVDKINLGRVMGIGDTLWLTSIFKPFKNTSTTFFDDERARFYSFLFDGLTNVEFDKDSAGIYHLDFLHENYGVLDQQSFLQWRNLDATQAAKKIFKILGVDEDKHTVIPHVNVSNECLAMGQDILNKLGPIENPIILVSNTSAGLFQGTSSDDWRSAYRTLKPSIMQIIINELSKKHTILHCGIKGKVFKFENVTRVYDLLALQEHPLKAMTGLYKIVGKYVGLDTGDYNLMLATGGECKVLIPDTAPWWNGVSSIFREDEFKWEKIRAEYINFRDYAKVLDRNKLSF